jgi:hypothetical protein
VSASDWRDDAAYWGLSHAQYCAWLMRLSAYYDRRAAYWSDRADFHGARARRGLIVAAFFVAASVQSFMINLLLR